MLDQLLAAPLAAPPAIAEPLERTAAAFARLDQALGMHPLQAAFLHRFRLEAVRRQAAVDGELIDPWHLAAVLEGLRFRMDGELRIIDRGVIIDAARHALTLHQWLTLPDFDQEGEVQRAQKTLASAPGSPLLAAAAAAQTWLDAGGTRPPLRAALIRHWTKHGMLRAPVPLTGAAALRAETDFSPAAWTPAFLAALAGEAADALQLLLDMERTWFEARRRVAGRRRHSRAPAAIDLMAATPLISAHTLAAGLDMAPKNAGLLLDSFCRDGIAIEVTHRTKRRLFGLQGLAPLRETVRPPYRPMPGRSRGRPPLIVEEPTIPPPPLPPLTPLERRAFDYTGLEAAMAFADQAIRGVKRTLDALARGERLASTGLREEGVPEQDVSTAGTPELLDDE